MTPVSLALRGFASGCAMASAALATTALAQSEDTAKQPDHLSELKTCQEISDPTARLNCFDRSVAVMVAATEEGKLRLVDQDDVRKARRRLFGFSLPDFGLFGGGDGEEQIDILQSTITRVRAIRGDSVIFEIEEGSVWQIPDTPFRIVRRITPGTPVEFKKAALGSYFIRVDGQTGVKGRRIE